MHIHIDDNTRIRDIAETFSNYYPYLRIEFFRKAHKKYEASKETDRIDSSKLVGDLKRTHVSGMLEIQPLCKTADVEKEFMDRFGLSVQILRKADDHWEQTTGMDDFTLKDLNEFGRNSSDEFIVSDYDEDFDETEDDSERIF